MSIFTTITLFFLEHYSSARKIMIEGENFLEEDIWEVVFYIKIEDEKVRENDKRKRPKEEIIENELKENLIKDEKREKKDKEETSKKEII